MHCLLQCLEDPKAAKGRKARTAKEGKEMHQARARQRARARRDSAGRESTRKLLEDGAKIQQQEPTCEALIVGKQCVEERL